MTIDWSGALDAAEDAVAPWRAEGSGAPGGTVVLFDRDGPRGGAAAGLASLPHRLPFTDATPARFASVTKHIFCSFALGHGLDPGSTLGELLPGLPEAFAAVPVHRALSMTGALPDLLQTYTLCGLPYSAIVDLERLDAFCDRLDRLDGTPGTELCYSNTGYRLVERGLARRGHRFDDWLEGTVNPALDIALRYPPGWDRPLDGLADGYWREEPEAPWRTGFYGPGLSASGALAGSARDLALWFAALLRGDGPAGSVLDRLVPPRPMTDGRESPYGLGLLQPVVAGRTLLGHGGSLPGVKNEILVDREHGLGVVVLSNREETDAQDIAARVMAALLGLGPLPAPSAPTGLPRGLFVEDQGPGWIALEGATLNWLGVSVPLEAGAAPGEAASDSPYMPVRLRATGDGGVAGEIGLAPRRFRPVADGVHVPTSFAGLWRAAAHNASLRIAVEPDGSGSAAFGIGPLHQAVPLVPLDETRALMPVGAMPWLWRACLWRREPDTLRLVLHRSRMLDFTRIG